MRKFTAVASLALGLTVPNVAAAAPIGPVGCVAGLVCDISVDDATGYTLLNAGVDLGFSPGWLVGYTFLLNAGVNTADGIVASEVAQALVIGADRIELYTSLFGVGFSTIVSNALSGADIGGTPLSDGQIVGTPGPGGVAQFNGVGTFVTAPVVTMSINWGDTAVGGADTLHVRTVGAPVSVPEPGSLTLLALGGAAAFMTVRRRQRAQKAA